mmetsp:Transcript_14927/g.36645  ORF Transcript_14927/g.36645 Transcript_14927/m.36645 type:complete len:83 (-) Transcript_14927:360-608(-)
MCPRNGARSPVLTFHDLTRPSVQPAASCVPSVLNAKHRIRQQWSMEANFLGHGGVCRRNNLCVCLLTRAKLLNVDRSRNGDM